MLVVKIELHSAVTRKAKEIGRMYICNDESSLDETKGNYDVYVCRDGHKDPPAELMNKHGYKHTSAKATRTGHVKNYPRLAYNVWRLIARSLKAAFPEEA